MAGVSIGIFGLVVERLLLWRVRGRVLPEVLLTLGLAFILGDVTLAIWGGDPQTVRIPGLLSSSAEHFGVTYPAFRLFAEGLMSAGHWAEGRPVKETQDFDDVYLKEYNQLPSTTPRQRTVPRSGFRRAWRRSTATRATADPSSMQSVASSWILR